MCCTAFSTSYALSRSDDDQRGGAAGQVLAQKPAKVVSRERRFSNNSLRYRPWQFILKRCRKAAAGGTHYQAVANECRRCVSAFLQTLLPGSLGNSLGSQGILVPLPRLERGTSRSTI